MARESEKKPPDDKEVVRMSGDEIIDHLFDPEVRERLKKLAHENRPKEKSDD